MEDPNILPLKVRAPWFCHNLVENIKRTVHVPKGPYSWSGLYLKQPTVCVYCMSMCAQVCLCSSVYTCEHTTRPEGKAMLDIISFESFSFMAIASWAFLKACSHSISCPSRLSNNKGSSLRSYIVTGVEKAVFIYLEMHTHIYVTTIKEKEAMSLREPNGVVWEMLAGGKVKEE